MANNTILAVPAGSTPGDPIRSLDRAGIKTQVVQLDIGGAAGENLVITAMPVTGAFFQATQPVSAVSLPLPTGAATEASLTGLSAKFGALGQTTMAGSAPVTIASNQTALAVTGTFFQATQPVSLATLPALTAGAAVIGALTANQSVNNAQIGGVAVAVGSGVSGTGVQRVVLATDVALPAAAAPSATYSASIVGLVTALTATDIFTITGSATKTVRVSRILVNGVQTTAAQVNVLLIKRSTANTAGTSTAPTRVPYDSANAAVTATVLAYTANPTLGTTVGTVSARREFIPGAATASDAQGLEIVSGDVGQQLMTLRGVAEVLAVNLNATTVAGSALNITVEWTES